MEMSFLAKQQDCIMKKINIFTMLYKEDTIIYLLCDKLMQCSYLRRTGLY